MLTTYLKKPRTQERYRTARRVLTSIGSRTGWKRVAINRTVSLTCCEARTA